MNRRPPLLVGAKNRGKSRFVGQSAPVAKAGRAAGQVKPGREESPIPGRDAEPPINVAGEGRKAPPAPPPPTETPPSPPGVDVPALIARATELTINLGEVNRSLGENQRLLNTLVVQREGRVFHTPGYEQYVGYRVRGDTEEQLRDIPTRVEVTNDRVRIDELRRNPKSSDEFSVASMPSARFENLPATLLQSTAFLVNRTSDLEAPAGNYYLNLIEIQALTERIHYENSWRLGLQHDKSTIEEELASVNGRIASATSTATTGDVEVRVNIDGAKVTLDDWAGEGPGPIFTFQDVRPGRHTVIASKEGYDRSEVLVNMVAGRTAVVLVTMIPRAGTPAPTPAPSGGTLVINGTQHSRVKVDGSFYGEGANVMTAFTRNGVLAGFTIPNLSFGAHRVEFIDSSGNVYSTTQVTLADNADQQTVTIPSPAPSGPQPGEIEEGKAPQEGVRVPIWGVLLAVTGAGAIAYFLAREG